MRLNNRQLAIKRARLVLDSTWVIFDFETTGLGVRSCGIVSVAALSSDGRVIDKMVNPEMPISAKSSAIHGITEDMVSELESFVGIHDELSALFRNSHTVIAYNATFDAAIYKHQCKRYGLDMVMKGRSALCAMRLASRYFSNSNNGKWLKLSECASRLGIDVVDDKLHGALYDVQLTHAVLERIASQEM